MSEPQAESASDFILDLGAAVGWGMSYMLFFGGGSLIGHQIRNRSSGILVALDYSYLYLPQNVWEQSAIILGVGLTLIAAAAVLHPPCARRMCMPPAPGV